MSRHSNTKRSRHPVPRTGVLAAHVRGSRKFNRAQKEAVLRTYHMHGSYRGTALALGISEQAVKRIVLECQLDPTYAHTRAQAFDEMSGKVAEVTDQVIASITPDELVTTNHKIYDPCGNLLRIVQEGPGLKDKALAIGILLDKQGVLQQARTRALDTSNRAGSGPSLLLPESIEDMRELLVQKVKRFRIMDVQFDTSEVGAQVTQLVKQAGLDPEEVFAPADGANPFD